MRATSLELEGDRDIVIARAFNRPARIVFDAWTRPELVRRWWAPASLGDAVLDCEAEVRVGGRYRYLLQPAAGEAFAFSGTYIEVTPHSRLIYTQVFEPTAAGAAPDDVGLIITVTFDGRAGRTYLVEHILCPSKDVRDAVLASGMAHGLRESMDQLDALVDKTLDADPTRSADVDAYIAGFPGAVQTVLTRVRRTIRKALPKAEEVISYQIPAYKLDGRVVLYFAGWKSHYSLYPSTDRLVAAFKDELAPYEVSGKGTIRFPLAEPVPVKLIEGIAKFRAKEAAERATRKRAGGRRR